MSRVVFAILLVAAFGMFAWTLRRFGRMIASGRRDARTDRLGDRLASVVRYFLLQGKVVEDAIMPAERGRSFVRAVGSRHHVIIFWGFLIITVGSAELFVQGVFPSFSIAGVVGAGLGHALAAIIDVFNLLVLVAIAFAVFRRMVLKPRLIPMSRDAAAILGGIAALMLSHFVMHALTEGRGAGPVSAALAGWLVPDGPGATAALVAGVARWTHVAILLVFLNYLLYSKHSHIVAALPNIFARNLGQRGILPKLDLDVDDIAKSGIVSEWKDFTWKQLLDSFACTECARCSNACPAYGTGKPLSPMQVIHDLRDDMKSRLPDRGPLDDFFERFQHGPGADTKAREQKPLIGGRTSEDVLWACTTCGACQQVCPVFIDHPTVIMEMRRNLVLSQEKVPADLARTFKNLEQNGNPWGIGADKRMDWAEGLGVPTLDEKPEAEFLLWVGCMGAYDDRIRKQTQALVEVLDEAGASYAVLGLEEGCSGDPARRAGNEMLYQMQAQQNVETLNAKKVKKVVTACPHCLHTIKNEYPQLGGNYEVKHHTQLLRELLDAGRITLDKTKASGDKVVFHDPCYLGRWNDEVAAPRAVLDAAPAKHGRVEPERTGKGGFCCGAGGGRMFMEEKIGTRVNHNRVDELLATGADLVATACPFCTTMVRDGVADRGASERVDVLNVSEIVARSMVKKRAPAPKT